MNLEIDLQHACEAAIPDEEHINLWVQTALNATPQQGNLVITVRVVEIKESQQLNLQYRNKNKPTNVLSFPFEIPPGIETNEVEGYLGDLVICNDIVNQESQQQRKALHAHWAHMCIHGTLHLLGFDHIEAEDANKMESIEIDLLATLGYANPYQLQ